MWPVDVVERRVMRGKKETLKKKQDFYFCVIMYMNMKSKQLIHEIKTTGNADDGKN